MNNDHQRPERIHSDGDKALFAIRKFILDGERERVIQHPVTLRKRHTMLLEVCRILFFGSNSADITGLYVRYTYLSTLSSTLFHQARDALRLRHYSYRTEQSCIPLDQTLHPFS